VRRLIRPLSDVIRRHRIRREVTAYRKSPIGDEQGVGRLAAIGVDDDTDWDEIYRDLL
jgi:hypothetical protein